MLGRGVGDPLVRQSNEEENGGDGEDHAAQNVEVARGSRVLDGWQEALDHEQRDDADRDIDPEDQVPAVLFGQEPTDERTCHERDAEDGSEQALVTAALCRAEKVTDDRQRDREQRTCADALDASEQDEHAPCSG